MTLTVAIAAFGLGVILVVAATERLIGGLVGLARAAQAAPFVAAAVLSGLEAENVAVGLAAGGRGAAEVALGTAFAGAIFLVCMALGLGAIVAPLNVPLPRGVVLLLPISAVVAGLPVLFDRTPRWTGAALLLAFLAAMAFLVVASRTHEFMSPNEDADDAHDEHRSVAWLATVTVLSIAAITVGGDLELGPYSTGPLSEGKVSSTRGERGGLDFLRGRPASAEIEAAQGRWRRGRRPYAGAPL